MEAAEILHTPSDAPAEEPSIWTYPTRFCRICREDVPATVTMYPPGLPMQFQKPIVEYRNEDEYGRLIKPCMCRGSLRYIHELCLLRSRTENTRKGSMWKCHECGHQFNFKKLTIQRWLSSKITITGLTILSMASVVFLLGFFADPIINIYLDPYDSLTGRESIWNELEIRSAKESTVPIWAQHFAKGFISMGLVGFLKTLLLNPFQWINLRMGGTWTSSRATTGRDRAVNISWIAIVIGVCSAFVFFYRWMQAIVQRSLQRIGNNIVDTQLPTDDDDLKPPPGWAPASMNAQSNTTQVKTEQSTASTSSELLTQQEHASVGRPTETTEAITRESGHSDSTPLMSGSWVAVNNTSANEEQPVVDAHRQGWSFSNL